jgi:hypothetical protein
MHVTKNNLAKFFFLSRPVVNTFRKQAKPIIPLALNVQPAVG